MKLLGVYNYTVILTYLSVLFSFAGIHFVFSSSDNNFILALTCLLISGTMDMFDGKIASTKKDRTDSEKLFGIQIDSMADIINYGVFPSLIVYSLIVRESLNHPVQTRISIAICGLYILCTLIRLSYFNVDEMERQAKTSEHRIEYSGLPVTSIAIVLPAVFIINYFLIAQFSPLFPCLFILILLGALYLIPFKMPKPAMLGKILLIVIGITEFVLLLVIGNANLT